jgi:uncharacterized membrane protein
VRVSLERGHRPAALRLAVAAVIGAAGGVATSFLGRSIEAALIGWDLTALAYLVITWPVILPLDAERTRQLATVEDNTRGWTDAVLFSAALASLLGLGLLLVSRARADGARLQELSVGLAGVLLSWALIHTIFTLSYARLFYDHDQGGVDFNQATPPAYSDFAYLAFTVGMTFQVSDTAVTSRAMRATVLRHALVSYLFGAVILAVTINLLAGLARRG